MARIAVLTLAPLLAAGCCWGGQVRADGGAGPVRVVSYDGFGSHADYVRRAVAMANAELTDERFARRLSEFGAGSFDHAADRGALRDDDGAAVLARLREPREIEIACVTPWWPWSDMDADAVIGGRQVRLNGRMLHRDAGSEEMLPYWAGTIAHEFCHTIGYEHPSPTARRTVPYVVGRIVCEQAAPHDDARCPGRPVSPGVR